MKDHIYKQLYVNEELGRLNESTLESFILKSVPMTHEFCMSLLPSIDFPVMIILIKNYNAAIMLNHCLN